MKQNRTESANGHWPVPLWPIKRQHLTMNSNA